MDERVRSVAGARPAHALRTRRSGAPLVLPLYSDGWLPAEDAVAFWDLEAAPDSTGQWDIPQLAGPTGSDADLVVGIDPCGEEAEALAWALRRPVRHLRGWQDLAQEIKIAHPVTVTIVATSEHLPYAAFDRMLLSAAGGEAPSFGFLTGRGRSAVRWAVAKALLLWDEPRRGRDLSIFACPPLAPAAAFEHGLTFWWNDLDPTRLLPALEERFATAALLSHANGIDGNFNTIILCPVTGPQPRGTGPRPSCLQSGLCQRDPQGTRVRIHPARIKAPIIFYDTCAGFFGHDGIASLAAALGTAFSESLCGAMLTTFRKKMSDPYAALLFRGLLQDGWPLGRIARELDAYQAGEYGELPSFVVLGDAAFRMPQPARPAEASSVRLVDSGGERHFEDWRTYTLRLDLGSMPGPAPPVARGPGGERAVVIDLRRRFAGNGGWIVRSDVENAALTVAPEPIETRRAAIAQLHARVVHASMLIGAVRDGLKAQSAAIPIVAFDEAIAVARDLLGTLDVLRQAAAGCVWSSEAADELARAYDDVPGAIDGLSARFCAAWVGARQWLVLHHSYNHWLDPASPETRLEIPCPACGAGGLTEKRSVHPIIPDIERRMWICIRCGAVADMPANIAAVAIRGAEGCRPGETVRYTVEVDGGPDPLVSVVVQPYFGGFGADVVKAAMPKQPIACRPDEAGKVRLGFDVAFAKDCPGGLYSLVVVGATVFTPFLAARYVTVDPHQPHAF
jgi:hypothetical protein